MYRSYFINLGTFCINSCIVISLVIHLLKKSVPITNDFASIKHTFPQIFVYILIYDY